jgi:acyl-CoA thioester hydrolase
MSERVQVVSSTLTWRSSARWTETVSVDVACTRVGRTSFTLEFVVRVADRVCCEVTTTYVNNDETWHPAPVSDADRERLLA